MKTKRGAKRALPVEICLQAQQKIIRVKMETKRGAKRALPVEIFLELFSALFVRTVGRVDYNLLVSLDE